MCLGLEVGILQQFAEVSLLFKRFSVMFTAGMQGLAQQAQLFQIRRLGESA